jgi:hypothetical protein
MYLANEIIYLTFHSLSQAQKKEEGAFYPFMMSN